MLEVKIRHGKGGTPAEKGKKRKGMLAFVSLSLSLSLCVCVHWRRVGVVEDSKIERILEIESDEKKPRLRFEGLKENLYRDIAKSPNFSFPRRDF